MSTKLTKRILAIETSFDEAGLAVVEYTQDTSGATQVVVKADVLFSQAELHKEYGGVYPTLAKQIHAKNLVGLFIQTLKDAGLYHISPSPLTIDTAAAQEILVREPEMFAQFKEMITHIKQPDLDVIAITRGPGLEPALWVGIAFAKALATVWDIPLSPVNHMEGHVAAALAREQSEHTFEIVPPTLPALALLISGAHTELVLVKEWLHYEKIGSTRDDAVGEAFDKVARLLGLPYPGGPQVSRLAHEAREQSLTQPYTLPRPMLHSNDYDFSLSGLKTAVRNLVETIKDPSSDQKRQIAREFEDAVTEMLVAKTYKAIEDYSVQALIVSGGVAANTHIKEQLETLAQQYDSMHFYIPAHDLATDNGRMIAFAAALRNAPTVSGEYISADGNLSLDTDTLVS